MNNFPHYASKFLQQFIKSQNNKALVQFYHTITFEQNEISALVSTTEIVERYNKWKTPTICTDNSGRFLQDGVYLDSVLVNSYKDCALLIPKHLSLSQKLGVNFGQHSVHIAQKHADYEDFFSFYFDLNYTDFLLWVVNNGSYLQDSIEEYKTKSKDFINFAHQKENRKTRSCFQDYFSANQIKQLNSLIHHTNKMPIYLTAQQSRALAHLFEGKTIKQIAKAMQLSDKTVEHYLATVRNLLDCNSNRDVLVHYLEQFHEQRI